MATLVFQHLGGLRVEAEVGETVFEVASRIGKPLSSACGAKATCGLCRVKVVDGAELLSELNDQEKKHLGNVYFITRVRLGCQSRITGDGEITLDVPARIKKKTP